MRELLEPGRRITNVVFMGMGEPLLNLPAVLEAVRLLVHPKAFAMAPRRITVSTAGIVPRIGELLRSVPVNLAVSLHATTDAVRDSLVPLNKRFPLASLLGELRALECINPRRPVFFEYTLIDGRERFGRGCAPARAAAAQHSVQAEPDPDECAPGLAVRRAARAVIDAFLARGGGVGPARDAAAQPRLRHPGGLRPARAARSRLIKGRPTRAEESNRRAPASMLYAVGDIHGESEMLSELLSKLPLAAGRPGGLRRRLRRSRSRFEARRGQADRLLARPRLRVPARQSRVDVPRFPGLAGIRVLRWRRLPDERRRPHARELRLLLASGPCAARFHAARGARGVLPPSQALSPRRGLPVRARGHRPPPARRDATSTGRCDARTPRICCGTARRRICPTSSA